MHLFYNNTNLHTSQQQIKTYTYKVTAQIHKLKINKNINFQTKILWKRHQNKVQTNQVTHTGGFSIFNQSISLNFSMQYNLNTSLFVQKITEFIPVIFIEGNMKSGGCAKLDISEALNLGLQRIQKCIQISKCPDPEAYINVTLHYNLVRDLSPQELSQGNSILNNLSLNISNIEVDNSESNNIYQQRQSKNISENEADNENKQDNKNIDNLENQIKRLRIQNIQLCQKFNNQQSKWKSEKKELQKQMNNLQRKLDEKNNEISQKNKEIMELKQRLKNKLDQQSTECEKNKSIKYEQLYKSIRKQLEEKDNQIQLLQQTISEYSNRFKQYSKQKIYVHYGGQKSFQIEEFQKKIEEEDQQSIVQQLERQKIQLQHQLASISHKLAEIFNVSFEIGGSQLVDRLQSSIGIIQ